MKQKLLEMIQVTVWLHTDEFIFVWFYKDKTDAKTAPRAPKLGYFDGRAPKLSARVNHGTPAAGVIGHMYTNTLYTVQLIMTLKPGVNMLKSISLNYQTSTHKIQ